MDIIKRVYSTKSEVENVREIDRTYPKRKRNFKDRISKTYTELMWGIYHILKRGKEIQARKH